MDWGRINQHRNAWQTWIAELIENRQWKVYFVTFMFMPLSGAEAAKIDQMGREVYRFYRIFITRVFRKPHQPQIQDRLPRLFAVPDRPVPKHEKQALSDVVINDGLHVHAVVLIPKRSRLQIGLKRHVKDNMGLYLGNHGKLRRIDIRRVKRKGDAEVASKVSDYLLKSWWRSPALADQIIIFPRPSTELGRSPPCN